MIKEALQYFMEMTLPPIVKIDEVPYNSRNLSVVYPPSNNPIHVETLAGFCAYVKGNPDCLWEPDLVLAVHIDDPKEIYLLSPPDELYCRRPKYIEAHADVAQPRFNQYMAIEDFMIWMMSSFIADENRLKVTRLVGNLTSEHTGILQDDGCTQVATVRAGITKNSQVEIENPIALAPYRTFAEVPQPKGNYVLRLRNIKDAPPQVALFEVYDCRWRLEAMASIADYLRGHLPEGTQIYY